MKIAARDDGPQLFQRHFFSDGWRLIINHDVRVQPQDAVILGQGLEYEAFLPGGAPSRGSRRAIQRGIEHHQFKGMALRVVLPALAAILLSSWWVRLPHAK